MVLLEPLQAVLCPELGATMVVFSALVVVLTTTGLVVEATSVVEAGAVVAREVLTM